MFVELAVIGLSLYFYFLFHLRDLMTVTLCVTLLSEPLVQSHAVHGHLGNVHINNMKYE